MGEKMKVAMRRKRGGRNKRGGTGSRRGMVFANSEGERGTTRNTLLEILFVQT